MCKRISECCMMKKGKLKVPSQIKMGSLDDGSVCRFFAVNLKYATNYSNVQLKRRNIKLKNEPKMYQLAEMNEILIATERNL